MAGEIEFGKLVSIAAAACLGSEPHHSPELILLCLQRARFCELLAPLAGKVAAEQYLIGLLSVIDAMLGLPMRQVLKMLPLSASSAAVLLGEPSPDDLPMKLIRHYERSQWDTCAAVCHTLRISEADLTAIYLESLRWASLQVHDSAL